MDGFINSSIEKQTIYEIYRACRLCGAGAGYKMPIMQNVVHLDGAEVELRQKIRECVQIEVHQEDKMPPLICELCVDKVNDFYEFLEMCRQTNKRTRLRLGLPPQTMPRGAPDAGDCILGVTEPVYLNEDSNKSLLKPKARNKGRFKKESQSAKKSNSNQKEVRSLRIKHSSPPPQRASKRVREDDISLSKLQKKSARPSMTMPKSILRKESEVKKEDDWSPTRSKRSRDSRDAKPETVKKVKIMEKPSPKSDFKCKTCKAQFNSNKALNNHMRIHNRPQPKCRSTLKQEKKNTCSKCKKDFQTKLSLDRHKCAKANANKCQNCGRHISNPRNLANHERACLSKKEFKISPHLLKQLRPIQIRVRRCDPLLKKVGECYDISGVDCNFGLDNNCIYPYLTSLRIKTEPSYMVNIHDTIDEFDLNHDYVHWDSDSNDSDLEISDLREKSVGTLANLSLRTIFSHKFLGKVPKRKRYVKSDKAYNSVLNFDSDVRLGIDNIINSLDNDRGVNDTKDNDNDSLFGDNKTAVISNDDFDSLFCSNNDSENTLNDDKRKSDDGECELVNKNTDIDNKKSENINEINNDTLTKLDCNDTVKNTQENDKSESSKVVLDNDNTSDINNDKVLSSAQDSITKEMKYKEDEEDLINNKTVNDSDVKENDEIILKNNDSISKIHTNYKESGNSINNKESSNSINKESEQIENVIENDDSVFRNENEKATVKINDNDRESNIPVNEKDLFINKPPNTELREVNDVENNDSSAHANDVENNDSSAHDNVKDKDSSAHDNVEDKDFSAHDNLEKNDSSAHINDVENNDSSAHNNDVENNDSSAHDNDFENNSSGHDNDNKTVTNNDNKLDKTAFHVNGDDKLDLDDLDDISDSEMDDSRLMDAIDEQLGEKEKKNKNQEDDRDSISDVKSADLESISSGELPNE